MTVNRQPLDRVRQTCCSATGKSILQPAARPSLETRVLLGPHKSAACAQLPVGALDENGDTSKEAPATMADWVSGLANQASNLVQKGEAMLNKIDEQAAAAIQEVVKKDKRITNDTDTR